MVGSFAGADFVVVALLRVSVVLLFGQLFAVIFFENTSMAFRVWFGRTCFAGFRMVNCLLLSLECVEIVCPCLHHLRSPLKVRGSVVGSPVGILDGVGQLVLDPVDPEVEDLV